MNWKQGLFFLIIIVVLFVFVFGQRELRNHYINKLTGLLSAGDFAGFEALSNRFLVKLLFTPYNHAYMRLNAAMMQQDKAKIDGIFKEFLLIDDMSEQQKEDIYMKAFNYYMNEKDYDTADKYKEVIMKKVRDPQLKEQTEIIYDIYALKSAEPLEKLLAQNEQTPENQRGFGEMLISECYKNQGDEKNAEKYKKLSLTHFKQLENAIRKDDNNGKQG